MSNESVNLNIKNMSVKFYLCKPDRTTIYPLNDIFNKRYVPRIGELATLSFSFHSTVLKDNEFIPNPLLDKLKGHYLIKMVMDGITQYFIITNQNKSFSSSDEIVNVQCYLEPYELTKRNLRGIEETSKSLRHLVTMCLEETSWSIDYIDGDVELLRRSYETSNSTILQSIFELAEKFNCIVEFNTHERNISFKKYENIGINKGIRFKEGIFLESFDLDIKDEDIVTRLVAYGENGLEFRSLTPNGVNYLQDFSWFMYPFECDNTYNVLKSSNYMSDELCVALVKYHKLLDSVDSQFETLKLNLVNKQSEGVLKQQQLADLNAEMTIINTSIDIINATYQDAAPSRADHQDLIRRKNEKQLEIDNVQSEIDTLNNEITTIKDEITTLQATISPTSNFTQNELRELTKFIREYEYTNDSIITAQDLLDETELVFEDLKQPPLSLTMSIEAFADYFDVKLIKKLALGDIIKLQSKTLKVDVTAKIHGFDYDLDNMTVSLDIANVKSMMDADILFAKSINSAINTSNTVNLDKYKWREGQYANTLVNQILQGEFDTAKNVLVGGTENSVTITERGLYNRDVQDSNVYMVINNGILAITPDGGNTVSVAISKRGVHAEKIVGKQILSNQMFIESNSGIINIQDESISIKNSNDTHLVTLGKYISPSSNTTKHGLLINNGAIEIINGLPKSQIESGAVNKWDNAESNAKTYTDTMLTAVTEDITNIENSVDELVTFISDSFIDGIIDEMEAKAIETYINTLSTEKVNIDTRYGQIYSASNLSGTPKTNLLNAKNNYNTAHNNLIVSINTAISDGKTTIEEKQDVDAHFVLYRTALSTISTRLEEALKSIETVNITNATNNIRENLRLTAPLPTSITMNADGITASTSTSTNFARLDYRGLYVQGGALDIRTSSGSNRGVIINGEGISAYNASGTRTFYVDTNGNLTANSATVSGIVNATGGTISGNLTVTGSLSGGSISGASISGGSISGASITGGSITSSTTINVSTDLIVGNNIYIGNDQYSIHNRKLAFNNNAYIQSEGYMIGHHALQHRFYGVVDFNYASSVNFGSNAPVATARFG